MAEIGNKHKTFKNKEWGSKERKYISKKQRRTMKQRIKRKIEKEEQDV